MRRVPVDLWETFKSSVVEGDGFVKTDQLAVCSKRILKTNYV